MTNSAEHHELAVGELENLAEDVLRRCLAGGADQAEVSLNDDRGLSVTLRLGAVEALEFTRDRGLSVTVYRGQRKATASTADLAASSIADTIEQALAIARYTEADPYAGLADPDRLCRSFPDLDLWHPEPLDPERAVALASACEAAGLSLDPRIGNSEGATASFSHGLGVYANSLGFIGSERGTRYSLSCVLVAGDDQGMQRDYSWDSARALADLADPTQIGREAAERALRRLGGRQLATLEVPVLFAPEVARGLIGHLVSAVSGPALYRRASFLLDARGQRLFPAFVQIGEYPHQKRGPASAVFDAEGVATQTSALVVDGVLERYVLGSYSARRLGLASTGNAGGVHNLVVSGGEGDLATLVAGLQRGLLVTEVMGQGVNTVTGDYSRGASGFWIEHGALAYPVEEITIAGNLRQMFADVEAIGADLDRRSSIQCGSVLVGRMMVAGA